MPDGILTVSYFWAIRWAVLLASGWAAGCMTAVAVTIWYGGWGQPWGVMAAILHWLMSERPVKRLAAENL